ncbi:hypothetical protein Poly51_10210 [Rubripirellula tenax]|uniref:Glycoside hydrolase 123 C-terminal domain-containing protein n=1 Tax=Rubripirellula tenax TaxID=2528015 RepID=A0A5C6FII6_9BACT|nr:Ig-like domain-containing protein [Rubripirellula tenax]TWU60740.1 hypothetical protein Poly51_10210 [Rubripirellula tenax]
MIRTYLLLASLAVGAFTFAGDLIDSVDDAAMAKLNGGQLTKSFDVRVTDGDGEPIAGVTVTPWALRSSQGHGRWPDGDDRADMSPEPVTTDDNGIATIRYPFYRDIAELTRVFSVSVNLSHPNFTIEDSVDIDVPMMDDGPHKIEMKQAASIALVPQSRAADFHIDQIHVVSSDVLNTNSNSPKRSSGQIVLETLSPAPFRAMLVRLVDGKAVEFSDPIELTLKSGRNEAVTLAMHPAVSIRGRFGDEVPRPVVAGRVCAIASPRKHPLPNFDWTQWAPVDEHGDFVIEGFPRSETMQVIALCEHFIAKNGYEPIADASAADANQSNPLGGLQTMFEMAKELAKPTAKPSTRPQVFGPNPEQPITINMSPLVRCEVSVTDPDGNPLRNILVGACPNVFWWNWGSQLYGVQLMRSTEWLMGIAVEEPWDSDSVRGYDIPFFDHSNDDGFATLYLPPGNQDMLAESKAKDYRLPIFMGRRDHQVTIVQGETLDVTLQLEPAGTEALGEYDKLAGVVFGCSTREGKQICALPEVRQKMDDFARRLREAKNPRDPAVLAEAFAVVAEAFDNAGDAKESAKWKAKADAEAAKAKL